MKWCTWRPTNCPQTTLRDNRPQISPGGVFKHTCQAFYGTVDVQPRYQILGRTRLQDSVDVETPPLASLLVIFGRFFWGFFAAVSVVVCLTGMPRHPVSTNLHSPSAVDRIDPAVAWISDGVTHPVLVSECSNELPGLAATEAQLRWILLCISSDDAKKYQPRSSEQ